MSTLNEKLDYLNETKQYIKQAIREQDVQFEDEIPFRKYANKIREIETVKWKPNKEWWDIESILENDTEDYKGKMIMLLTNEQPTTEFQTTLNCSKIKTSDGGEYTTLGQTHTWDETKDKSKTRYIIFYYTNDISISGVYGKNFSNCIYIIYKGDGTNSCYHKNPDRWHSQFACLKKMKFDNITVNFFDSFGNDNVVEIENCKFGLRSSFHAFNGKALITCSFVNITQDFRINNSTNLTHKSLLNLINALKDYSSSTTTHTLIIGYYNVIKLSEEEIATVTLKGWVLS